MDLDLRTRLETLVIPRHDDEAVGPCHRGQHASRQAEGGLRRAMTYSTLDKKYSLLYSRFMGLTGQVLNHLRRHRLLADGMTQAELAERVGVTRQTIHSIEKGKYKPTIELALRLARELGVAVEDLLELDDQEKSS